MKYLFVENYEIMPPEESPQKEEIKTILLGTSYEMFYSDIFENLYKIRRYNIKLNDVLTFRKDLEEDLNIASALLVCRKADDGVYINNSSLNGYLLPDSIKTLIEKELEKEYIKRDMNQRPMTFEEGYEIMSAVYIYPFPEVYEYKILNDALKLALRRNHVTQPEFLEKFRDCKPSDEIVREFILGYSADVEITIDQIDGVVKDLEDRIEKLPTTKGAPVKNHNLYYAIHYLKSVGFTTCNKDLRCAFHCLDIMGFIEDSNKKAWAVNENKHANTQWLKSRFESAKDYNSSEFLPF